MNDTRHQSLFFINLPELQKLCAATVTLSSHIPESEARSTQIKICRQLLFLHQEILSAPVIGTLNQISVVMAIPFYRSGICQAYVEQQGATLEAPQTVSPAILQACLSYTLAAKLAPRWNKAGHLLVQGRDFLSCSGKQNAVVLDLNVSERQLCISVEACLIRLPPPECFLEGFHCLTIITKTVLSNSLKVKLQLGEFDILANTLKLFESNENMVIHQHSILSNWCYVLPSMKMGQIINISHIIPPESPFHSYEEFQLHWKNLYGYVLPEDLEETKIYASVYFKPIGERFFTYPLSCIRSQPVQYFPRTDSESVLNSFLADMKLNLSHLCGFPVKMTSKALYATQELSRAPAVKSECTKLDDEMVCVVSLTQAPPRKQTLPAIPSSCSVENSHWMERLVREPEEHTFLNSSKSTEKFTTEATEKSMNNRQPPGVPELSDGTSLGMPVNSVLELPPQKVSKIIPIFKGKLIQMNGRITNQVDGKRRENTGRHSPIKMMGVSSSVLSVHESSITQICKPVQTMSVRNPTQSSVLRVINMKTYTKRTTHVLQWKAEASRGMANSDFVGSSASSGNSSEVSHKKANSPSFPNNVGPAPQKPNIHPSPNTSASPPSSARRGKKFTSHNTSQVLDKQLQSNKVPLQICKLDNEMTNFDLSQQQRKRSNEKAGLNIHGSVSNDSMHVAKSKENKGACRSQDYITTTNSHHSKSTLEQKEECYSKLKKAKRSKLAV